VWRNGDRIALDRDDVAGARRKRPVMPPKVRQTVAQLGHPSGGGMDSGFRGSRAEYLSDGAGTTEKHQPTSSVGRGLNKWVEPREFRPWNGETSSKGANRQ
jgi:hypothetical protein